MPGCWLLSHQHPGLHEELGRSHAVAHVKAEVLEDVVQVLDRSVGVAGLVKRLQQQHAVLLRIFDLIHVRLR
jgi:hypothetical protein